MLKPATNNLGKGDFVLACEPLGVAVKLIGELDLRPDHTSKLHRYRKYINWEKGYVDDDKTIPVHKLRALIADAS